MTAARRTLLRWRGGLAALLLGVVCASAWSAPAPEKGAKETLPAALTKTAPESVADLREMQKQTKAVLAKVVPATVGVIVGSSTGSGVIVSPDGYVLTAGHVSTKPGQEVLVLMHDGKRYKGKSLGWNKGIDSGLIKITDAGKYPFVPMGRSAELKTTQWCVAVGHPRGYMFGRSPVVRVGRISSFNSSIIRTDCTLVGGDSGGPLFDMTGKVIGIHSRIGLSATDNVHVPVDTYRGTWDLLAKSEVWGGGFLSSPGGKASDPYLGLQPDIGAEGCTLAEVVPRHAGEKAGLKVGDVILKFDGKAVANFDDLLKHLGDKKADDEVSVEYRRGTETKTVKLTVGKRR